MRVGARHAHSIVVFNHVFRPDSTLQILAVGVQMPAQVSARKAMLTFDKPDDPKEFLAVPSPASPGGRPPRPLPDQR